MSDEGAREARVTLAKCPIGLFRCGDTLALKTEYGSNEGRIDAYIVETGEFFWGDQPQTIASQRAQLVEPIETDFALSALSRTPPVSDRDGEAWEQRARAVNATDLHSLADRVEAADGADNSLDVEAEVALFEPCDIWRSVRANFAGTKVVYTDALGDEHPCWARDWTKDRPATAAALRARAASIAKEQDDG